MKRRLSSLMTFLMKVVFPAVWITGFGLGTLGLFFGVLKGGAGPPPKWLFLVAWVAGSTFIYWACVRLKEVSVDDDFLYVSNYLKEERVPLSDIYDVTENRWLNIHPVTIHLNPPSAFGPRVVFMPQVRIFGLFSSHPVVAELKGLARSRSAGAKFIP